MCIHYPLRRCDLGVHASQRSAVANFNTLDRTLNLDFLCHAISPLRQRSADSGTRLRGCALRARERNEDKSRCQHSQENYFEQSKPNHRFSLSLISMFLFSAEGSGYALNSTIAESKCTP